jgi:hypothetical protein
MKKRYTVLGVVTALLPNLYAYAGESQAGSMAGGTSASGATTQQESSAGGQPTNTAQTGQNSSSSTTNNTQSTTQSNNQGGVAPYQKPIGSSTEPVQGRSVNYTMPATAKPVVKSYTSSKKPVKRTAVTRTYR